MHRSMLFALAFLAVALAVPQNPVYILNQESDVNPEGYQFQFQTSDGTARQEQGVLKQVSEDHKAIEVQGSYKYVAPDGITYTITYTAGQHGFQPQESISHQGDQQQYAQQ